MFTLKKEFRFEAAHKLPFHDGQCARLHGHSWKMRVVLEGHSLCQIGAKAGMLQDFSEVSKVVKPFVEDYLDHHYLNETTPLVNPTSEALACWVFEQLRPRLPLLVSVEIDETCTSSCCYRP